MTSVLTYADHLVEQRNKAWHDVKAVLDGAVEAKRDLTAEERATVDRANAAIDQYDVEIKDFRDRSERAVEAEKARDEWGKIVRPDVIDRRDESEHDQLRAVLRGERPHLDINIAPARAERAAIRRAGSVAVIDARLQTRALGEASDAVGGALVPTTLARVLYDYLEVFSGMRRTNATIVTTASGEPMDFPVVTSHGTAAQVAAGSAIGEGDPVFDVVSVVPYKYAQLLQINRELLEDSGIDLNPFVGRDMGRACARASDTKYVLGTGSGEPGGLLYAIGTAVVGAGGTAATAVSFTELIRMVYGVNEEYRLNGAQWLMQDATAGSIRQIKDSTGNFIWSPSTILGQPDRLLGYPVVSDPNVVALGTSAKSIAFGDMSAFLIRDVGSVRVEASRDYAFDKDRVTYRATLRSGSAMLDLTGAVMAFFGGTA